jgi:hypothetical protein
VLRYTTFSLSELPKHAPDFIRQWKKSGWKNVFTTTLHVLNSAIIKMSKTTEAVRVFRGTKGGVLPKQFWQPNDMKVRGGIELGFMSTTLEREMSPFVSHLQTPIHLACCSRSKWVWWTEAAL